MSVMFQGVRLTSFQESLSLDSPKSLANLFVRVNKYIHHIEVMRTMAMDEDRERKRNKRDIEENLDRR